MDSNKVFESLQEIAKTSATKVKQEKVGQFIQDELFRNTVEYALNPHKVYGVIPQHDWITVNGTAQFDNQTFELLDDLIARRITGHVARDAILYELARLEAPSANLLVDVIKKDLRAGFSESTVNKVYKDLIPEYSYMRCSTLNKIKPEKFNWKKGVFSQCLDYNWELLADDGKKYKIGDIVENKLKLNVLSYENDKPIFKPITAYFENEIQEDDEWYTISYYKDGEVITTPPLTDNHKVILEDGREVYVRDLQSGDFLRFSSTAPNSTNVTE